MNTERKKLFASFLGGEIFGSNGRLLFRVLYGFASEGYHIRLYRSADFEELGKDGQMMHGGRKILSMPNLELVDVAPENCMETVYLFDKSERYHGNRAWKQKIQVKFDVFSSYWFSRLTGNGPLVLPFTMHPVHYQTGLDDRIRTLRDDNRCVRIFFSGDTKGYTRNFIRYPREKLPRATVIETVLNDPAAQPYNVASDDALEQVFDSGYLNKCVIAESDHVIVKQENWLEYVSKADFFLCPPGIINPLCHNAVEAMAVGTIPLINYPEWFIPSLVHMENCVVFTDREDLVSKIELILGMKQPQIDALRRRAIRYYDEYLQPGRIVRELESRRERKTTLLIVTNGYIRDNARKLNARSAIIDLSSPSVKAPVEPVAI